MRDLGSAGAGFVWAADVHDESMRHSFQFLRRAAVGGLEADFDFALRGKGFPGFLLPLLVLGNEQLVGRRGFFKNLVEHALDAALVEFLHDLWRGDRGSFPVAQHDERRQKPVLPLRQRLLEVEPVEVPGVFWDFEWLDHARQSTAIRWVRPTRSR